jgi:hypothetical protein
LGQATVPLPPPPSFPMTIDQELAVVSK